MDRRATLSLPRRVADHADLRLRLGRGQARGPHPGRPDGVLHVLELKKDKTPREVVAQVLDYGSWVRSLAHEDVLRLFAGYGKGGVFEAASSSASTPRRRRS